MKDKKITLYGKFLNTEHIADKLTVFHAIKPFLFQYDFSAQKCPDVNLNYPDVNIILIYTFSFF